MTLYTIDTIAEGLGHPQSPQVLGDGSVIFAETYTGGLKRIGPDGGIETLAQVGGGPNGILLASDQTLWFTQNGGQAGEWRSSRPRTPALCRLAPDGSVEEVARSADGTPFVAPHDLVEGVDGSIYMTDSGRWDPATRADPGRIVKWEPDGTVTTVAELGPVYPSGIAVEPDGAIVWAECYTNAIYRMYEGERPHLLCTLPDAQLPECVKAGPDGTLWVAALFAEGVVVLDGEGRELDFIRTGGLPLNCALSDSDLYVADLGPFDDAHPDSAQLNGRILKVAL